MTTQFSQEKKSAHTILFFIIVCALFLVLPQVTRAEQIERFTADIVVTKDSSFTVTEEISYAFTGSKHGIFRCIPTIHEDPASSLLKERYTDLVVRDVQVDGHSAKYTVDENRERLCLSIGDPQAVITGTHTYRIVYEVQGAISFPEFGGSELYWDVTGNEWEVPIREVTVRVSSPDSILFRERACYRGRIGESSSCNVAVREDSVVEFSGSLFGPNEGLTIAQALDRSKITYDVRERYKAFWLWGVILLVAFVTAGALLYRYKTAHQIDGPIIPQYEPYPEVKPMYAGMIMDHRLDPRDIVAGIIYLAKEGFISIRSTERKILKLFSVKDFEFTLLRSSAEVSDTFDSLLIDFLFRHHQSVGEIITLHSLTDEYTDTVQNRVTITALKEALQHDLHTKGFIIYIDIKSRVTLVLSIVVTVSVGILIWYLENIGFIVAAAILGLVMFLSNGRRTKKGYEAFNHLKGFRDFLRVTESQRYIFHNAPEKNAEQFMEYLPYAIAFGVEKEWAKTFEGITIPNPRWYDGGSPGSFNAALLTQSLGSFTTALAQASSSGTSASGGGGTSGGGSGGGGGGSW